MYRSLRGTKVVGSRKPLHEAQSLCLLEQARLHVRELQRGQVYLGVFVWQIVQRDVRRGSVGGIFGNIVIVLGVSEFVSESIDALHIQ